MLFAASAEGTVFFYGIVLFIFGVLIWYVIKLMTDPEFRKEHMEYERRKQEAKEKASERRGQLVDKAAALAKFFIQNRK